VASPLKVFDMAFTIFFSVILAAFGSMAIYTFGDRRRDADAQSKSAQLLGGKGDFILHWFMWLMKPVTAASIRMGLTADFYNWLGLALGAGSVVLLAYGHLELGGWAIALSGIADIMDGRVSRATGKTSLYGDFIDSALDRFIEVFIFMGVVVFYGTYALGVMLAVAALGGSLLVSYTRARGESLGVDCTGGLMQRGERLALLCLLCLSDRTVSGLFHRPAGSVLLVGIGLIAATGLYTAVYRTVWIAHQLRRVHEKS
jgi:phosphatidylinositol phosphate synthase